MPRNQFNRHQRCRGIASMENVRGRVRAQLLDTDDYAKLQKCVVAANTPGTAFRTGPVCKAPRAALGLA